MIRQGSPDLIDVFLRTKNMPVANDTSVGVGFAPLSPTEQAVMDVEQLLNSAKFKKKYPEVGEDVKVMGMRIKDKLNITVAAAMVSGKIPDASPLRERHRRRQEPGRGPALQDRVSRPPSGSTAATTPRGAAITSR